MPSFDIVSKVDIQALDNAVNVTTKEIRNRFDFKGSHVVIDLKKKEFSIAIAAADDNTRYNAHRTTQFTSNPLLISPAPAISAATSACP